MTTIEQDANTSQAGSAAPPAEVLASLGRVATPILWVVGVGLSVLPPLLVVLDRWLHIPISDPLKTIWCRAPVLCQSALPAYFLWIIPAFGFFILLFLTAVSGSVPGLDAPAPSPNAAQNDPPGKTQRRLALAGISLAAFVALTSLALALRSGRIPGLELALAVILFLLASWLRETRLEHAWAAARRSFLKVLPPGIGLAALIFLLRSLALGRPEAWIGAVMFGLSAVVLIWRRLVPPVFWVVCVSLALMVYRIGYWQFSVIGDEYSFYSLPAQHLSSQNAYQILNNMFDGTAVYGAHPYFSSMLQMASMALLGADNFGWRFSSIFMAAFSLFFFYDFFRQYLGKRAALWSVIFLGASQYMMTFGKIGYNNLQALFGLGLALWAAGRAARLRSTAAYALLGAASGLCFYLYPAAIYAIPLAGLLLLFYDPPWKDKALARWGYALAALTFFILPLLVQPDYWQAKIPGTFLQRSDAIKNTSLAAHLGMNMLYSLFSYVYAPAETHFVVASYIDPITASLLPAGLALTLRRVRRSRFALFWILGFIYMLFAVGATHDRMTPSTTRMFMVLPWFCLFAGLGLVWLAGAVGSAIRRVSWRKAAPVVLAGVVMAGMLPLNLYMAYDLSRQRTLGVPSLEVLFLRLLQREKKISADTYLTYTFVTDANWGIDGIRTQRDVYNLPRSQAQLERVVVDQPALPPDSIGKIAGADNLIIVQPWLAAELKQPVEQQLAELGKLRCDVRDTPKNDVRFTLWINEKWSMLCPWDGEWGIPSP